MKRSDLFFAYPEELIGKVPEYPPRVLSFQSNKQANQQTASPAAPHAISQTATQATLQKIEELSWQGLLDQFQQGDVLVINDTQVLRRRLFSEEEDEILFLNPTDKEAIHWEVLFPSKKQSLGARLALPRGIQAELVRKGRPQLLKLSQGIDESYFNQYGELPLPPYIQKARLQRHNFLADNKDYQTSWAEKPGSLAAPTASLHFKTSDLEKLESKGVQILKMTLHVGLGTFMPVTVDDLDQHPMHSEYVEIPLEVWSKIQLAKRQGHTIWSLGTTVTRSLESQALGYFKKVDLERGSSNKTGPAFVGLTDLLIQPGFDFKVVDRLLTNFHQPESTLLSLVAAFAGLENVKRVYALAIEKKMRLFSYGDLSVWTK